MIALALATYLTTQAWGWDRVAGADGYYLYWTQCCDAVSCSWPPAQSITVDDVTCVTGICEGDFDTLPDDGLVLFAVTAFNEFGESSTEHGPVEPCP